MKTITAKFKGDISNLEMFLFSGIKAYSTKTLGINTLTTSWNIDEDDDEKAIEECMGMINMRQMELWNIEVLDIQINVKR